MNETPEEEEFAIWDVTFEGEKPGTADDFVLSFVDSSFLVGEPLLTNQFVDDLVLITKQTDHYNIIGNIKEIIDDEGVNQSDKNIYAILGILNNGLRIGFLIGNVIENSQDFWHVAAVWPEGLARKVLENPEVFRTALLLLVDQPETWARVDIIIPISGMHSSHINLTI
jgi:hypothetical protein